MLNIQQSEDDSYIKRRDHLLTLMKRQRWDDDDKVRSKRGRKPKPTPRIDTKVRSKNSI